MLSVGLPAPFFRAKSPGDPNYVFDTVAGRNVVLVFNINPKKHADILLEIKGMDVLNDEHSCLFFVLNSENSDSFPLRIPGIRCFYDDNLQIHDLYLDKGQKNLISFILSPRLQVVDIIIGDEEHHVSKIKSKLDELHNAHIDSSVLSHAPVLIIPNIFEKDFCEFLIGGYEKNGGTVSGFMRDVDGKTMEVRDERHKIRKDWNMEDNNPNILTDIRERFKKRVIPEIKKAYQYDVTRIERYIISCYEAEEGGHFRPHRDNTTKATLHRKFAVSLNLNSEDYEGGELRFPEFGMKTFKPPTGGCCVFSCSLLHEATKVTQGKRYAFLPFLYDDEAARIRSENLKFLIQR